MVKEKIDVIDTIITYIPEGIENPPTK